MFEELVRAFATMKLSLEQVGANEEPEAKLEELNQQFVNFLEDWRLLGPEQQPEHQRAFLSAQVDFHVVARHLLEQANAPAEPESASATRIEQTGSSAATENQASNDQESTDAMETETVPSSKIHGHQVEMDNSTAKPMASLSYFDHSRVLDPIYSLRPIEYIDEQLLDEVINCIHETMRRAHELDILVPNEVVSTIIAYIHSLLDFTSQSMLSWRFSDEPATLDSLIHFLQTRATRILPVERAPASATQRVSGPSAPKKAKKLIHCPLCNGPHPLIRCEEYKSLAMGQRRREVARLNLCENCLTANHQVNQCNHGPCRKCGTKHNSTLPCSSDDASGGRAL